MKTAIQADNLTVLIEDDRILAVGTDELCKQADRIIDTAGACIQPGFHDSHLHLLMTGQALTDTDLSGCTSIADIQAALQKATGPVIHGMGWNQEDLKEHRMPERADLDAVTSDIPIVAERACTHILSANSAAMKLAGCWKEDGIFAEDACIPFMRLLEGREKEQIEKAVDHCLAAGLTCVQPADLKARNFRQLLPLYKKASERIRIIHQVQITDPEEMKAFMEISPAYETPTHRFGPFKGFADGALGGRTAFLSRDYADDPGNRGQETMSLPEMIRFVEDCGRFGKPALFHAIGDQAIANVLTAYETVNNGQPNGIIHVQITDESILERMERSRVHAYVQPVFWKADEKVVRARTGDLADTSYAFHRLYKGVPTSFGTDCPIEDCDPLQNIEWAMRLPDPFTSKEALDAYTRQPALCAGIQDLGCIAPGYLADFVFLKNGCVVNTMVAGKLTHDF